MKTKYFIPFIMLALFTSVYQAAAQETQFFRIAGPAATAITAIRADGTLVWNNALAGTNYTVQMATSLGGGTNWVDYVQLPVTDAVNVNRIIDPNPPAGMRLIPAGLFQMGDNLDEETDAPVHPVYVSAFYMDKYDVTYALWQQVYNWAIAHGYIFYSAGSGKAANHPVQTIYWNDAVMWCNARSEMEGRTPAYYTDPTKTTVYRGGYVIMGNDCVIWNAGYRLPTEAEWEKAARGGLSGQRFPWGNTISWSQANYYTYQPGYYSYDLNPTAGFYPPLVTGNYPYTSPVDYFAPNGYGLYDMEGNVLQWCWDWYDAGYASGPQTDPQGPTSGTYREARGGAYFDYAPSCQTANRGYQPPSNRDNYIGFRSVLSPGQ
jgi:formylglycine-generating enzyme required for sulfatase activity